MHKDSGLRRMSAIMRLKWQWKIGLFQCLENREAAPGQVTAPRHEEHGRKLQTAKKLLNMIVDSVAEKTTLTLRLLQSKIFQAL